MTSRTDLVEDLMGRFPHVPREAVIKEDLLRGGMAFDDSALRGTPVLMAATAGTARHSLVLEHAMRPMLSYLKAVTVPTGVFAASEDWGTGGTVDAGLSSRITVAATELADLVAGGSAHGSATSRAARQGSGSCRFRAGPSPRICSR